MTWKRIEKVEGGDSNLVSEYVGRRDEKCQKGKRNMKKLENKKLEKWKNEKINNGITNYKVCVKQAERHSMFFYRSWIIFHTRLRPFRNIILFTIPIM